MNKLIAALTLAAALMLAANPLSNAQEAEPEQPAEADETPAAEEADDEADDKADDEATDEEPLVLRDVPLDFSDYIRRVYPSIDPGGAHDIHNIEDFSGDPDLRHDYTAAMTRLILLYIGNLEMGPMLSKLFDQHARGQKGEMPTFKVLHAVVLIHFPPNQPNLSHARTLLSEAAAQAPDYAYPWFYLSQLERISPSHGGSRALNYIERAVSIRPQFSAARSMYAELLMSMRPPRENQARELIEPELEGELTDDPDDYDDLLLMYATIAGPDAFHEKVAEHLEREDLPQRHRVRAYATSGRVYMQLARGARTEEFARKAIDMTEQALKHVDASRDPRVAMRLHRNVAVCWGVIAMDMRERSPELAGMQREFDHARLQNRHHHQQAAEIERTRLPIAMRGHEARAFVELLVTGFEDFDYARRWLEQYLEETDLSMSHRNTLENMLAEVKLLLDPTEEARLDLIDGYIAQDQLENLASSLRDARIRVRGQHERFTTTRALTTFISLLDSRERRVVRDAAFLAATTALELGPDAVERAAKAIVTRFEQEIEANTEAQAALHQELSESIKLLDHVPSHEGFVRHLAKLVRESDRLHWVHVAGVISVWNDREYLAGLKPPMSPQRRTAIGDAGRAATWLESLANHLKRQQENE